MFNAEIETLMKTRPSVVKLGLSFQHLWLVGMGPLDFIDNQILIPNFRFDFEVYIYVYMYLPYELGDGRTQRGYILWKEVKHLVDEVTHICTGCLCSWLSSDSVSCQNHLIHVANQ